MLIREIPAGFFFLLFNLKKSNNPEKKSRQEKLLFFELATKLVKTIFRINLVKREGK